MHVWYLGKKEAGTWNLEYETVSQRSALTWNAGEAEAGWQAGYTSPVDVDIGDQKGPNYQCP